jgi:hypothetical protein
MNRRLRIALAALPLTAALATVSDRAMADGATTLTLSQTSFNVSVAWDGTVTGVHSITASASHSDAGAFCDKITEADIMIITGTGIPTVTLGSYVLPRPICSFNNNDVSMQIQPFTESEMVGQCASQPGAHLTTNRFIGITLQRNGGYLGTQWNGGSRDTKQITMVIDCASAPTQPPAQAPTPAASPTGTTSQASPGGGTVGTPPLPSTSTDPKSAITPAATFNPALNRSVAQVRASKPAGVSLDPSALALSLLAPIPTSDKAALDAAKAQFDADYAKYVTAAQSYAQSYKTCLAYQPTIQDYNNTCTDTDLQLACMRKIFAKCMAPAQQALDAARAPLRSDASKTAAFATALGL